MGQCHSIGRTSSTRSLSEHGSESSSNRSSSARSSKAKPNSLAPIVLQQPIISPPGSPLPSTRHTKGPTPSSSGISSASSSSNASVLSQKSNADNSRFQYIALFDYDARTKDDLAFRKSDLLEIVSRPNHAWWIAKNERGQEGWIPSNFVARRNSLESEP